MSATPLRWVVLCAVVSAVSALGLEHVDEIIDLNKHVRVKRQGITTIGPTTTVPTITGTTITDPSFCSFPFIYRNVQYSACTTTDHPDGKLWCSTNTDNQNNHINGDGNWRHCTVNLGGWHPVVPMNLRTLLLLQSLKLIIQVEEKLGIDLNEFEITSYSQQVVAGMNYDAKVIIGANHCIRIWVFSQVWTETLELTDLQDHVNCDDLIYGGACASRGGYCTAILPCQAGYGKINDPTLCSIPEFPTCCGRDDAKQKPICGEVGCEQGECFGGVGQCIDPLDHCASCPVTVTNGTKPEGICCSTIVY